MEQTEKDQLFSAILGRYFADQALKPGSEAYEFVSLATLDFILDQLNDKQRGEFISLLEEQKGDEVADYALQNIPDFGPRLTESIKGDLEELIGRSVKP